ncbi:MAG: 4Fe-4S binding protein [Elusimicrobiales bacterium]
MDNLKLSAAASIFATLPVAVMTALFIFKTAPGGGAAALAGSLAAFGLLNFCFYRMLRTGKTDAYRAPVFIFYALMFAVSFISNLIEARGSMALHESTILEGGTPFCHIVIPFTLVPFALTRTIIFPGTITGVHAAIASMFVLWIGASLAIGRGWCGWICFFGGWDDMFSRLRKTARVALADPRWRDISAAVLVTGVLLSAASLSPFYCEWLCPYKCVTEFVAVTSAKILFQTLIFISLFIALVIALPVLTKRRTQCGFFCPFGALQSLTNKINPFEIKADASRCSDCGACARACPVIAITAQSIARGGTLLNCIKCGKCVDVCPRGALGFDIKLTAGGPSPLKRLLFLYPAFIFLSAMASGTIADGLRRLLHFMATGSFL